MDDERIVQLYWERSERAVSETSKKYGSYCRTIAYNILMDSGDADECVNDTYLGAWNSIPPHRPAVLSAYLGKLTRRISINRWKLRTREKRGGGETALALDELSDCVPSRTSTVNEVMAAELSRTINRFLSALDETERDVFLCRYWLVAPVSEICDRFGFSQSKVKSMLARTRGKLRKHLQKEGFM